MDFNSLAHVPVEQIYQALGQLVADAIPEAWERACAYAEIEEDDNGLTYGYYVTPEEPAVERDFDTSYRFYFLFKELRRRFRQPGQSPWVKARFTLYPDGHFDLDVTYPEQTAKQ